MDLISGSKEGPSLADVVGMEAIERILHQISRWCCFPNGLAHVFSQFHYA